MSREIKFRIWDESLRGYLKDSCDIRINAGNGSLHGFRSNGNVPEWIAEQYIGLKDRNGVEIYEGDVVNDHVGVGVVEYTDSKAAFRVNYKDGFAKWFIDYLEREQKTIEVIGNIYESPELLEQSS